jgi:protein gp37
VGETSIEWTDRVWNPVTGCTKVSAGCKNCYAERVFPRAYGTSRKFTDVLMHPDRLEQPLRWRKPQRIFVNSMSDLFHEDVSEEFIDRVFVVMMIARQHKFQILTKRPERMRNYVLDPATIGRVIADFHDVTKSLDGSHVRTRNHADGMGGFMLSNVHLGVSVEDQKTADERIPLLLETPAAVRFVSYEPALVAVDFLSMPRVGAHHDWLTGEKETAREKTSTPALDWIIIGGESGPKARPFNLQWARDVIAQCKAAGVPVFMKQLGAKPVSPICGIDPRHTIAYPTVSLALKDRKGGDMNEWPEDLRVREFPR